MLIDTSTLVRTLQIRHPSWCQNVTVNVNGRHWIESGKPGTYIAVDRKWRDGDSVEVKLPMSLHFEALPGRSDVIAMLYGPIVLAGRLGRTGLTSGADTIINERSIGDVLKENIEVPRLVGNVEEIVKHVKRSSDSALAFRTDGIGDPFDVELIPYFRIAHERYNLYWETKQA